MGAALIRPRSPAACARSPDDYLRVYRRVLSQVDHPVVIHWLGDMFDPALAGYWGHADLDLATDVLLHPSFPDEELARYKQRTRSGFAQQRSNPGFLAGEMFSRALYGTHPLGRRAHGRGPQEAGGRALIEPGGDGAGRRSPGAASSPALQMVTYSLRFRAIADVVRWYSPP